VDEFFLAASYSWHCLLADRAAAGAQALSQTQSVRCAAIYQSSVAKLVETAQRFCRFQSPGTLQVNTASGPAYVPIEYHGLDWPAEQIERWVPVGEYEAEELTRRYRRAGVGAPLVGVRRRIDSSAGAAAVERFFPQHMPLAATAVLRPNLHALLGTSSDAPATLEFYNPAEVASIVVHGQQCRLAADLSAPWALLLLDPDRSRVEYGGFFRPEETADSTGLYLLEPYQPGKIPVVMVHGLISGPWTWADVINEIEADPDLRDRYQVWVFRYPTGGPLLHAAARLRSELRAARQAIDPRHADPALDRLVLLGYSLGGLIAKLQVSYGCDELWRRYATRPLDSLRLAEADRCRLRQWFYFEPEPYVARVVCIATPHRGTRTRNQFVGRFAANFVRLPQAGEMAERIAKANPGAFRVSADELLATSSDMLAPDDVLSSAIRQLPVRGETKLHSVIGTGEKLWGGQDSDGVVTVESARLAGAASECLVPAEHGVVHRHPQSVVEFKRILRQHWREAGLGW
jgi:hypothetical protein